jgi:hypothetical protein
MMGTRAHPAIGPATDRSTDPDAFTTAPHTFVNRIQHSAEANRQTPVSHARLGSIFAPRLISRTIAFSCPAATQQTSASAMCECEHRRHRTSSSAGLEPRTGPTFGEEERDGTPGRSLPGYEHELRLGVSLAVVGADVSRRR